MTIAPRETVNVNIARSSKIEDNATLARLGRSVDLSEIHMSKTKLETFICLHILNTRDQIFGNI